MDAIAKRFGSKKRAFEVVVNGFPMLTRDQVGEAMETEVAEDPNTSYHNPNIDQPPPVDLVAAPCCSRALAPPSKG